MRDFEIVPHGRSGKDAALYKFMDWLLRKNRDEIREVMEDRLGELLRNP